VSVPIETIVGRRHLGQPAAGPLEQALDRGDRPTEDLAASAAGTDSTPQIMNAARWRGGRT
jgi:hypothetical protein